MKKTLQILICSTFLVTALYAGKTENEDEYDRKTILTNCQKDIAEAREQQKNIIKLINGLQIQFEQFHTFSKQFSKSTQIILAEAKKQKLEDEKEFISTQHQNRIKAAGDFAVQEEKRKWELQKTTAYNIHREKVSIEINRAKDEGRVKYGTEGIERYTPLSICVKNLIDENWISIEEFRRMRNVTFDEKQKSIKNSHYEAARKRAEQEEIFKISKEIAAGITNI